MIVESFDTAEACEDTPRERTIVSQSAVLSVRLHRRPAPQGK
jgi:hypothetical protein